MSSPGLVAFYSCPDMSLLLEYWLGHFLSISWQVPPSVVLSSWVTLAWSLSFHILTSLSLWGIQFMSTPLSVIFFLCPDKLYCKDGVCVDLGNESHDPQHLISERGSAFALCITSCVCADESTWPIVLHGSLTVIASPTHCCRHPLPSTALPPLTSSISGSITLSSLVVKFRTKDSWITHHPHFNDNVCFALSPHFPCCR